MKLREQAGTRRMPLAAMAWQESLSCQLKQGTPRQTNTELFFGMTREKEREREREREIPTIEKPHERLAKQLLVPCCLFYPRAQRRWLLNLQKS